MAVGARRSSPSRGRGAIPALLAAGLGLLLPSCAPSRDPGTSPDGTASAATLRRGLGGEPATLDPHRAIDSFSLAVLRDLFEGVVTEDARGRIVPGAAQTWSVSADGLEYVFRLRPGLRWSNGDALTAGDFAAGLRRALDPATASPAAGFLDGIRPGDGVAAPDDLRLEIRLSRPVPYLLKVLATPVASPLHRASYGVQGVRYTEPGRLVSNGAYRFVAWRPASMIVLERNEYYHRARDVAMRRVEFHPFADASVEFTRYRAGALDITSTVPAQAADLVRTEYAADLQVAPFLSVFYYAFDLTDGPFRGNRALREALSLALDRERLVRAVATFAPVAAYGFVPPGVDGYEPQALPWRGWDYPRRLALARERYAAAGFGPGKPLRVTLLYHTNDAIRRMTVAVAEMWRESLGVEVTLIAEDFRSFLDTRRNRARWDLLRMGWNADYDDATNFLDVFRARGQNNDAGYENPSYDALLAQAALEMDHGKRQQFLQQAERLLLEDHVVVPVYFYVTRRLVKPGLEGPPPTPLNHTYSRDWRPRSAPG